MTQSQPGAAAGSMALPNSIARPQPIQEPHLATPVRPYWIFDVPADLAKEFGITTIGIVEITAREHGMALKRVSGGNDSPIAAATMVAYELALQTLVMVNDTRVSIGDGTADAAWNNMKQPIRDLIASAYNAVNARDNSYTQTFLSSRRLTTG